VEFPFPEGTPDSRSITDNQRSEDAAMLDELWKRIAALTQENDLHLLVEHARAAIESEYGLVPVWEAEELAAAAAYASANWLRASLLIVSQLPDDEYWGGYSYTRPGRCPHLEK